MTTAEKLEKIAARCKTDVAAYAICENILSDAQKRAMAASKSTLAAIELCQELPSPDSNLILSKIIAAWPDDLL